MARSSIKPPLQPCMGSPDKRMRILAIAYACEPGKGSEPGVGWVWSRMLARLGETWVVTRANNRPAIEEALSSLPPEERPRFVYVDLPAWAVVGPGNGANVVCVSTTSCGSFTLFASLDGYTVIIHSTSSGISLWPMLGWARPGHGSELHSSTARWVEAAGPTWTRGS